MHRIVTIDEAVTLYTGRIVAAEWDFEGIGDYPVAAGFPKVGTRSGRESDTFFFQARYILPSASRRLTTRSRYKVPVRTCSESRQSARVVR